MYLCQHVTGAPTAGRHTGLLGLACVFSTLVVADGPFLQRASTVVSAPIHNQTIPLKISMLPDLQNKRFGSWTKNHFHDTSVFNNTVPTNHGSIPNTIGSDTWENNLRAEKSWSADEDLVGVVEGCEGQCEFKLRTLGLFPTSCTTHKRPVDYNSVYDWEEVLNGEHAPPLDSLGVLISINIDVSGEREKINLITGYSTVEHCNGVLNYKICSLEAGIGDYNVKVEDNKINVNSLGSPELVSLLENPVNRTYPKIDAHLSTLGPVVELMWRWFGGSICYFRQDDDTGIASITAGAQITMEVYEDPKSVGSACPFYLDPHEDVMKSITKLIVYMAAYTSGLHAGPLVPYRPSDKEQPVVSEVIGHRVGNQNVYSTEYKFFIIAAVIEVVCIALVAPTYWGWWKLGRPVSFSPLETAKAFESPMFAACNSNSSGRDLAGSVGNIRVQYGSKETEASGGGVKMAFADPDEVSVPRNGSRFDA